MSDPYDNNPYLQFTDEDTEGSAKFQLQFGTTGQDLSPRTAVATATLEPLRGSVEAKFKLVGVANNTLPPIPLGVVTSIYDINVYRGATLDTRQHFEQAEKLEHNTETGFSESQRLRLFHSDRFTESPWKEINVDSITERSPALRPWINGSYEEATEVKAKFDVKVQFAERIRPIIRMFDQEADDIAWQFDSHYTHPGRYDPVFDIVDEEADYLSFETSTVFEQGRLVTLHPWTAFEWAKRVPHGLTPPPEQPPEPEVIEPFVPGEDHNDLVFCKATKPGSHTEMFFGRDPCAKDPVKPQKVYILMPSISLYRLSDLTPIAATNVVWSSDLDTWSWRFSATLKRESDLQLLRPSGGNPVEIGCEINGHLFTGLVTSYRPSRQFGQSTYQISGLSRSAYLADPYTLLRSQVITADTMAGQIAEAELLNTGFTLSWQTQDWLVTGGAYSYQDMAPMNVIKRLADSVGAIVQSHPSEKEIIVKPRFAESPHTWAGASPDGYLPSSLIQSISSDFINLPEFNKAIVTGGAVGGVIVSTTRDGTAGDILPPIVTDELITSSDAGYERGRIEIGKGGSWERTSFDTWLTDLGQDPGLLLPGDLIQIDETDDSYKVMIASTQIQAQLQNDALTVRQRLTSERKL